ncbi:MAG: glutamate-5-semialdehyde dehydrogenase [Ahniella sp.]|nr:glutamate-5-semialdehyde dehydrogenase [Ahniella sp.]
MSTIAEFARASREASRLLAASPAAKRQQVLQLLADQLQSARTEVLAANEQDVAAARAKGQGDALIDRLTLTPARLDQLATAVRNIAAQADPVGEIVEQRTRADGLELARMRVPLGVIAMIFEARPNVTIDAAALCLKSGNAAILRGGSEAICSNRVLASMVRASLDAAGLPTDAVQLMPTTERSDLLELLRCDESIDLVIPRGGEGLIRFVAEHSRIPVIRHYKGVCHLFVDQDADLDLALRVLLDGKVSRPAVCNALETLLVDAPIAAQFLPRVAEALGKRGVGMVACPRARAFLATARDATDADWDREYLDLMISVRVVDGLDEAMAHISRHGSLHTEVIITRDAARAQRFQREVDASAVMWNASSRFNDGGELGLGAEIGISTTKIHAYGAMGLAALTTQKWLVSGDGHIRHPELL